MSFLLHFLNMTGMEGCCLQSLEDSFQSLSLVEAHVCVAVSIFNTDNHVVNDSHTHRQLSEEQLLEAGIAPDLIRLSVGIEDVEDILADIKQALDQI